MTREQGESATETAHPKDDASLLQRLRLRFKKQPLTPPEKNLRVEPIVPYPSSIQGLNVFESFEHPLPYHIRYDALAIGIEQLHNSSPKVRKGIVAGQVIRPRNPHHGFTTYELDWGKTLLSPDVREFLRTSNESGRINIATQIFNQPILEGVNVSDSGLSLKYPVPEEETANRFWLIGQRFHRMIWVGGPKTEVELHVQKGEYYYDDMTNMCCPEVEYNLKYLTIGEDGKYKSKEDPRNFHSLMNSLPSSQLFIAKRLLEFAHNERLRQDK